MVTLASEFPNDNPELHDGVSWVCLRVTGAATAVREEKAPRAPSMTVAEIPEPVVVAVVVEPLVAAVEVEVPAPRISEVVAILGGARREVDDDLDEDDSAIVVEDLPPLDEAALVEGDAASIVEVAAIVEIAPVVAVSVVALVEPEPYVETTTSLPPANDDPVTILLCTLVDIAIAAGSPHVASVLPALLLEGRLDHAMPEDASAALAAADIAFGAEVTPAFAAKTRAWAAILRGTSDDFDACGGAMLDEWAADLLARLLGNATRAEALRRDLRSRGVAAFGLVEAA